MAALSRSICFIVFILLLNILLKYMFCFEKLKFNFRFMVNPINLNKAFNIQDVKYNLFKKHKFISNKLNSLKCIDMLA